MSSKSARIAELIDACRGQELDARYLGFFECFNRGLFYEAHDVLEELWLGERQGPSGAFYKGLIQLAGAFVHLRKKRLLPAGALFKLTRANLSNYPVNYQCLDVAGVLILVEDWLHRLEASDYSKNPLTPVNHPILKLSR